METFKIGTQVNITFNCIVLTDEIEEDKYHVWDYDLRNIMIFSKDLEQHFIYDNFEQNNEMKIENLKEKYETGNNIEVTFYGIIVFDEINENNYRNLHIYIPELNYCFFTSQEEIDNNNIKINKREK